MKKALSIILALAMLPTTGAFAAKGSGEPLKYLKSETAYKFGSGYVYVAMNKATGKLIPLSIGPLDGYSYAYLPNEGEIEIAEVAPPQFSDISYEYGGEMYVNELAARDVIRGYEDGTFRKDEPLTRAQMAAVFARLFDVEQSGSKSVFKDVADDAWEKGYVMALYERGVFKKDELFNPNQLITREQLTAMLYRMLSDMGYIDSDAALSSDYTEIEFDDFDKVADYAKEAYAKLSKNEYRHMFDLIENDFLDTADDEFYLRPQNTVTRGECVEYLYDFLRDFTSNNAPAIRSENAPDIEIPVLDGSTSTYPITQNIYRAYYQNAQNHPDYPEKHSKTTNSYKRLIDGEVEMIFVPDASKEVMDYAAEKGVELKFIPIANEALVFFTSKDNAVDNITTEQLHEIYVNNGITNWSELGGEDAELAAYCRNEDSGSHAQMEKFILNGGRISESISKARTSIIMSSILTDVDDYNRSNAGKYAMGYSLYFYYMLNGSLLGPLNLKLMSIDGVVPSEESIANGSYPYTTNYYAVIRDSENNPKIDAFAELMSGEFGAEMAALSGFGVRRYFGDGIGFLDMPTE